MFELENLRGNTFRICMPTNIGIYKLNEQEVILIDTGINERSAARILSTIYRENWRLNSIILTHAHTDHAGGCKYLVEQTGCKAYASEGERMFVEMPDMEPAMVYGAFPCRDFRVRFMNTPACKVYDIRESSLVEGMEVFSLPGHFVDMIGIKTPDDVYFVADSLISRETLEQSPMSYIFDVESYLETLESLKKFQGKLCVPSHAEPTEDIAALADINRRSIEEVNRCLLSLLETPLSVEALVARVTTLWSLPETYPQYVMTSAGVRTHLTYLRHKGLVDYRFEGGIMRWNKS